MLQEEHPPARLVTASVSGRVTNNHDLYLEFRCTPAVNSASDVPLTWTEPSGRATSAQLHPPIKQQEQLLRRCAEVAVCEGWQHGWGVLREFSSTRSERQCKAKNTRGCQCGERKSMFDSCLMDSHYWAFIGAVFIEHFQSPADC